jgi:hypothetical protein
MEVEQLTKKCTCCGEEKPLSDFYKKKKCKFGVDSRCKLCVLKKSKKYRKDNKKKIRHYKKQWYNDNKEQILEQRKQYYENNRESLIEKQKQYHQDNREIRLEHQKQYRKDNREYFTEYKKQWQRRKRKTDPLFRFRKSVGVRTHIAFKRKSWIKGGGTEKLLGCDWETAFNHIESQFESWMNWDNHGEWHIDHIIPLSSATTKEEMKKLCHYTNLQPLLAEENLSKGDKILN